MKHKYLIRLATEKDLNALVRLEEVAFDEDRFTRDQIRYLLTESPATTFIIENERDLAGAACVLWRRSQRGARLYNIAIDPAYQGQGLGNKLLAECELEAARRGCDRMSLEVREDNAGGIRFYERLGYEITRTMPEYYADGETGIKMAKTLSIDLPTRVRYKVPYYHQTLDFTCGPACLMMTLRFYFPDMEWTRALEMQLWKEATLIFMAAGFGGTDGYGLALSALNRGLRCRLVSSMDTTPLLRSVRIPEKRDVMKVVHHDMRRKARQAGLSSAIFDYGIDEIVSALHRGIIPIVMISTYRLTGDRVPHWVVVTGFDADHVFIHDPDLASYRKDKSKARNIRIEKEEFIRMARFGKEGYRCLLLVGPPGKPLTTKDFINRR